MYAKRFLTIFTALSFISLVNVSSGWANGTNETDDQDTLTSNSSSIIRELTEERGGVGDIEDQASQRHLTPAQEIMQPLIPEETLEDRLRLYRRQEICETLQFVGCCTFIFVVLGTLSYLWFKYSDPEYCVSCVEEPWRIPHNGTRGAGT